MDKVLLKIILNYLSKKDYRYLFLYIDELTKRSIGDSDETMLKKLDESFLEAADILSKEYGEPIYKGIGQLFISYKGPANPGFYNYKVARKIAWWKTNDGLISLNIHSVDGGMYPELMIEIYYPSYVNSVIKTERL